MNADHFRNQPGYDDYKDVAERTPLREYPWGMLLGNALGIGAAHALGYYAGGAATKALAGTRAGAALGNLTPATRRRVLGHVIGAAGAIGVASAGMASLAGQVRVAEELSRLERERRLAAANGNPKLASVYANADLALRWARMS